MIYSTIKDLFKGICDAIRSKDGTAEVINHQDIPSRIQAIQSGLDTTDATATADDILAEKTAYVNGSKVTGSMTNNGAVAKTLDTTTTSYTVPAGYHDGSGKVQVSTETKTATPTASSQSITPSIGKVLSEVTVHAIPSQYVDTSDADATAANIQTGKTAYVNGVKITGSISSKAAESYTPGTADQTIAAGQYLSGAQTIKGDANLVAGNIKSGVSIFGVAGTYEGSGGASGGIQAQHITSASDTITISGSGTVKVWGYGYYSSGMYTKTIYAFAGDGYYTALSYGTPSKHSATFGINADGTLSGLPSNVSTIDALITIGA